MTKQDATDLEQATARWEAACTADAAGSTAETKAEKVAAWNALVAVTPRRKQANPRSACRAGKRQHAEDRARWLQRTR